MDILKFQREMEERKAYIKRLKEMKPMIDTSVPSSLGLKHLATRPKKQQLIDDRNDVVARDNKKLMENMTKIMTAESQQKKHMRPASLNETERKLEVDRINLENGLMAQRLQSMEPIIKVKALERDFKKHLKIGSQLRRRQLKPLNLSHEAPETQSKTFDNDSYALKHAASNGIILQGIAEDGPVRSIAEFRRHVISSKRMANGRNDDP